MSVSPLVGSDPLTSMVVTNGEFERKRRDSRVDMGLTSYRLTYCRVEVELPSLGTSTYARVLDACGAVKDTTFGCNDA